MIVIFLMCLFSIAWSVDDGSTPSTPRVVSERGTFSLPEEQHDVRTLNKLLFSELAEETEELKKVKFYLLNGETRMARVYLKKIMYSQSKLKPVIHRYLGIISFIEGKYQKSFEYLDLPVLRDIPHYAKVCPLQVLNQVILGKTTTLKSRWEKCKGENALQFESWNILWLDTLVQMKLTPYPGVTRQPFIAIKLRAMENSELKVFLKLSIYLNQESLILEQLQELSVDQLADTEVRELVGQIYFRTGALAKSYKYIEDLKSPNAENIKGNLYVLRNKYEIAYAQFKLALEQKQNSQNAMERLIPLAWLLGDWKDGAMYAERVVASPNTQINKLTLVAAFNLQKGDYEKAHNVLNVIAGTTQLSNTLEVGQLRSFVSLMQNDPTAVKRHALAACKQFDFTNCWTLLQMDQWDTFPLLLRRSGEIPEKREWEKLSQNDINEPLNETVFVNQIDIEELDDRLIQLIPKKPQ